MANVKLSEGSSDLHISDVLDVIEQDPEYAGQLQHQNAQQETSFKAQNTITSTAASTLLRSIETASMLNSSASASSADPNLEAKRRAYVKILEQPASKALRFRYECEGRSAGSIPGANSTLDTKTFPTIQVVGYRGRAVVVVSCVTKDVPYRPHPHSLVGKEGCKKGVCTIEINNENMTCTFSNLGIQCVKKKGIEDALKQREEIRVDPYHTGFGHRNQPQTIDLNAVRLCFQVFLEGAQPGKFTFPLKPVVSDPIFDKKAMCDLTICKLSDFTSPVSGGKEIIMLCDKVTKDDIQVRFYEEMDGQLKWEGFGEFAASDVHKQVAISFRTPRYNKTDIEHPVDLWIQLRRPSDGATSESRPFQFLPLETDAEMLKRKRSRLAESNSSRLVAYIQSNAFENHPRRMTGQINDHPDTPSSRPVRHVVRNKIKKEPIDLNSNPDDTGTKQQISQSGYYFDPHLATLPPNLASLVRFPVTNSQMPFLEPNISPSFPDSAPPNPTFQQYPYLFPVSPSVPVNIPPRASTTATNKTDLRMGTSGASYLDMDSLNVEHPSQVPGDDLIGLPPINISLSGSNVNLIDDNLLENLSANLSMLEVCDEDRATNESNADPSTKAVNTEETTSTGARPKVMHPPNEPTLPVQSSAAMTLSASDFPELSLSTAMMSSADLDPEVYSSLTSSTLIKEIEDLNSLSKTNNQQ